MRIAHMELYLCMGNHRIRTFFSIRIVYRGAQTATLLYTIGGGDLLSIIYTEQ